MNIALILVILFLVFAVVGTFFVWQGIWRRLARVHVEKAVERSLLKDYDGAKKHMLIATKLNKEIKEMKQMIEFYENLVQENEEFFTKHKSELLNLPLLLK